MASARGSFSTACATVSVGARARRPRVRGRGGVRARDRRATCAGDERATLTAPVRRRKEKEGAERGATGPRTGGWSEFFLRLFTHTAFCVSMNRRDAEARRGERPGAKESGERRWERCGSARLIFLSL